MMYLPIAFVSILFLAFSALSDRISYSGYSLLRITPVSESQLSAIGQFKSLFGQGIDIWLGTTAVNSASDILVSPSARVDFLQHLENVGTPYVVLNNDVESSFEEDTSRSGLFGKYQSVNEIEEYLEDLASEYSNQVSVYGIGTSYEGRTIQVLRISSSSSESKPAVWIQGGAHAREKIGPAVVLYIATQLASKYEKCKTVTELVDDFDWYLLPLLNPDGYEFVCEFDPLWRKTRSRHPNAENCVGVDANRNWYFHWNDTSGIGSSSDPCSANYKGPRPFSEPEVRAASHFILENLWNRLKLFVDFHSYSQKWLAPWGYTSTLPNNYEEQKRLAKIGTSALEKVNGTKYLVGSSGNDMYTVSGGGRDWAHGVMKAPYTYVVELRDKGKYGFLLPASQILPTAIETWEGIKAMGKEMRKIFKEDDN